MTTRLLSHVTRPLVSWSFWGRFAQYQIGVAALGLGVAIMLAAGVGLGPWSVFHEGLSAVTGLTFGRVLQLVGLVVIGIAWTLTQQRPGPGTIMNMLLVGPWVDFFGAQAWLPTMTTLGAGLVQFVVGTVVVGIASGMYIAARFGAGPRDGLVLGLSRLSRWSVRRTRTGLEALVLALGFLLGGSVGLGTVLFALLVGPAMQLSLRVFTRLRGLESEAHA